MSYRGDREMHDATCGDCGKQCQVPFEKLSFMKALRHDCILPKTKNGFVSHGFTETSGW